MLNILNPILKPSQKAQLILILKKNELYTLLKKYECLFGVNLGTCHGKPYDNTLKPNADPYHGKLFPVPRIHELTFKKELDRIEALKFIKTFNRS